MVYPQRHNARGTKRRRKVTPLLSSSNAQSKPATPRGCTSMSCSSTLSSAVPLAQLHEVANDVQKDTRKGCNCHGEVEGSQRRVNTGSHEGRKSKSNHEKHSGPLEGKLSMCLLTAYHCQLARHSQQRATFPQLCHSACCS